MRRLLFALALTACTKSATTPVALPPLTPVGGPEHAVDPVSPTGTPPATSGVADEDLPIGKDAIEDATAKLIAKHGKAHEADIVSRVAQVGALWRKGDGDLAAF